MCREYDCEKSECKGACNQPELTPDEWRAILEALEQFDGEFILTVGDYSSKAIREGATVAEYRAAYSAAVKRGEDLLAKVRKAIKQSS